MRKVSVGAEQSTVPSGPQLTIRANFTAASKDLHGVVLINVSRYMMVMGSKEKEDILIYTKRITCKFNESVLSINHTLNYLRYFDLALAKDGSMDGVTLYDQHFKITWQHIINFLFFKNNPS